MRSEMCRVSRPHAVAGLRWHTQLTGGIRSSARHGSRVAGLRRVALFPPTPHTGPRLDTPQVGVVGRWGRRELRMEPSS